MSQKRVAMISYHTCPLASQEGKETGGMNVYVLELSKELVKKNIIVDIFTRSQDTHNPDIVEVAENLRVIHLPAGPQKSLPKRKIIAYIDDFVSSYDSFVQKEGRLYNILHCHYYLSGLIGLKITERRTEIPLVMSFHTLALMKNLVARTAQEKESILRIDAEFLLTKKVQKIISSSETDSLYLQYLYNSSTDKLIVIPPGIDSKRFHPIEKMIAKQKIQIEPNKKIILFVGRIEPLKGIDTLIYAMKILVTRNPDLPVSLLIVGGDISQKKNLWANELKRLEQVKRILHIP